MFSLKQKRKIVAKAEQLHKKQKPATGAVPANWAKETFGLDRDPNRCTITQIFRTPPPLAPSTGRVSKSFRKRNGEHKQLERVLYQWICE